MSRAFEKSPLFLILALAAIVFFAMCTPVEAVDVIADFSAVAAQYDMVANGGTDGGWISQTGADGGRTGGGILHWAAHAEPYPGAGTRHIRLRSQGYLRFDTNNGNSSNTDGSFCIIDFDDAQVDSFFLAEFSRVNSTACDYRPLIREAVTNKWYAGNVVQSVGGVFNPRRLLVGESTPLGAAASGHLIIKPGGIVDVPGGNITFGQEQAGEDLAVGILEIVGSGASFYPPANLNFRTSSTLKFTADAAGFGFIACDGGELRLQTAGALVEIDASLLTGATKPSTFTLVTGRDAAFIAADLAANLTMTPPAGGDAVDWSLTNFSSRSDGVLDALALLYRDPPPAKLASDPAADLALADVLLDTGATRSSATVAVTNTGVATLSVNASVTGEGFTIESPTTFPQDVRGFAASGDTLDIVVVFDTALLANLDNGSYTGTLTLESNSDGEPSRAISLTVDVSGFVRPPVKDGTVILY